jgi:hypothetical protein
MRCTVANRAYQASSNSATRSRGSNWPRLSNRWVWILPTFLQHVLLAYEAAAMRANIDFTPLPAPGHRRRSMNSGSKSHRAALISEKPWEYVVPMKSIKRLHGIALLHFFAGAVKLPQPMANLRPRAVYAHHRAADKTCRRTEQKHDGRLTFRPRCQTGPSGTVRRISLSAWVPASGG